MASSKLSETLIGREVERLFGQISARHGDLCWNPVTGAEFVYRVDPIGPQKKMAHHALLAREDFAVNGPADAPPLPLEHGECEQVRWSGRPLDYFTAQYAKCMVALARYNVKAHLCFDDYASGVLWQHDNNVKGALCLISPLSNSPI